MTDLSVQDRLSSWLVFLMGLTLIAFVVYVGGGLYEQFSVVVAGGVASAGEWTVPVPTDECHVPPAPATTFDAVASPETAPESPPLIPTNDEHGWSFARVGGGSERTSVVHLIDEQSGLQVRTFDASWRVTRAHRYYISDPSLIAHRVDGDELSFHREWFGRAEATNEVVVASRLAMVRVAIEALSERANFHDGASVSYDAMRLAARLWEGWDPATGERSYLDDIEQRARDAAAGQAGGTSFDADSDVYLQGVPERPPVVRAWAAMSGGRLRMLITTVDPTSRRTVATVGEVRILYPGGLHVLDGVPSVGHCLDVPVLASSNVQTITVEHDVVWPRGQVFDGGSASRPISSHSADYIDDRLGCRPTTPEIDTTADANRVQDAGDDQEACALPLLMSLDPVSHTQQIHLVVDNSRSIQDAS